MRLLFKLIVFVLFSSLPSLSSAQEKYAVLVAVDNYYSSPGVKHHGSLSGCVNDARSMKGLLEYRFGFNSQQIYTLYDVQATKKNLIAQLRAVYQKAKAGDAVVFFFSGHGVWMSNETLINDPVKKGMSQAIVMHDLYSPGWDCLVRDETLKEIFNQFVDKKIILTSIFDCCYSANLAMNSGPPRFWEGWFGPPIEDKDLDIDDIAYLPDIKEPLPCQFDAAGVIIDTFDTDLDGLIDCKDWQLYTPLFSMVDARGVLRDEPDIEGFLITPDPYYDSAWFSGQPLMVGAGPTTKTFNLKDALKVNNKSSLRPSDRNNSAFLSLGGAADINKGLEVRDISGIKHGAFTAALMMAYKTKPATISFNELWGEIGRLMKQQSYDQEPGADADPQRYAKNLIGIGTTGFTEKWQAKVERIKGKQVVLNRGWTGGLTVGNVLTAIGPVKSRLQVIKVSADSATAIPVGAAVIKAGDWYELTDGYSISQPYIKLHIPSAPMTREAYETFFKNTIVPLSAKPGYMDYNFDDFDMSKEVIYYRDATRFDKWANEEFDAGGQPDRFCVLLPIPSYIRDAVVAKVGRDQNFQLVNDPKQADLVLYLNYTKPKPGAESGFMLYWHPPVVRKDARRGEQLFSEKRVILPSMNQTAAQLKTVSNSLYGFLTGMLRQKTNGWINGWGRR